MSNPKVKINKIENLSCNWYKLDKIEFDYQLKNGNWQNQLRECYDRGDGAAILLFNSIKKELVESRFAPACVHCAASPSRPRSVKKLVIMP